MRHACRRARRRLGLVPERVERAVLAGERARCRVASRDDREAGVLALLDGDDERLLRDPPRPSPRDVRDLDERPRRAASRCHERQPPLVDERDRRPVGESGWPAPPQYGIGCRPVVTRSGTARPGRGATRPTYPGPGPRGADGRRQKWRASAGVLPPRSPRASSAAPVPRRGRPEPARRRTPPFPPRSSARSRAGSLLGGVLVGSRP